MTGWKACRTEALVSNDSAARGDHCRSFNSEFAGRKFGMRISFMNVDPRRAVESRIGNTENGSHSLPQTLIVNFRWFGPGPIGFAVQRIYHWVVIARQATLASPAGGEIPPAWGTRVWARPSW